MLLRKESSIHIIKTNLVSMLKLQFFIVHPFFPLTKEELVIELGDPILY